MDATRVTVLGGGNTAFSLAANVALAGSEVVLWEHPARVGAIAPIRETRTIHLAGTEQTGTAVLAGVTTDNVRFEYCLPPITALIHAFADRPASQSILGVDDCSHRLVTGAEFGGHIAKRSSPCGITNALLLLRRKLQFTRDGALVDEPGNICAFGDEFCGPLKASLDRIE
jgi:hypothetical protein